MRWRGPILIILVATLANSGCCARETLDPETGIYHRRSCHLAEACGELIGRLIVDLLWLGLEAAARSL